MKWKQIVKIILPIIILVIILIIILSNMQTTQRNLYSWKMNSVENIEELLKNLNTHKIKNVYQDFTNEYINNNENKYIETLNKKHINVYYLTGDPSWGKDKSAKRIIEEADRVIEYNKNKKSKIKGIVLDVEPYNEDNSKKYKSKEFKIFVDIIKKSYKYYQENNIELILCIPFWYDEIDNKLLEELIKNVDKIEVMNYNQENTLKNISQEIKYAKQYNKKISTIYELNFNEKDKFKTYEDIENDFKKIKDKYLYEKLELSYHHYNSMLKKKN